MSSGLPIHRCCPHCGGFIHGNIWVPCPTHNNHHMPVGTPHTVCHHGPFHQLHAIRPECGGGYFMGPISQHYPFEHPSTSRGNSSSSSNNNHRRDDSDDLLALAVEESLQHHQRISSRSRGVEESYLTHLNNDHNNDDDLLAMGVEQSFQHFDVDDRVGPPSPSRQALIDALPRVEISERNARSDSHSHCAVCQERFRVGSEARKLPCDHIYHSDCIVPWLGQRSSCPVCRLEVTEQSLRNSHRNSSTASTSRNASKITGRREARQNLLASLWPFGSSRSRCDCRNCSRSRS